MGCRVAVTVTSGTSSNQALERFLLTATLKDVGARSVDDDAVGGLDTSSVLRDEGTYYYSLTFTHQ
jgi:hypothetical protein